MDQIELTAVEQDLAAKIEFDALALRDHIHARENAEIAAKLMELLLSRKAIPEYRIRAFSDDSYAPGRGPSPRKQFQRNGNSKGDTIRHPHFLAWLRYFLYGPDLPRELIEIFSTKVDELAPLTSSDSETLRHFIRQLTKRYGLKKSESDEVFKLVLEFDDDVYLAQTLRREARKVANAY